MIQRTLAIWSLVPLPFLKPAWTAGRSWFTNCWILAWRILSITLLAVRWVPLCSSLSTLWQCNWNVNWPFPVLWPLLSFPNLLPFGHLWQKALFFPPEKYFFIYCLPSSGVFSHWMAWDKFSLRKLEETMGFMSNCLQYQHFFPGGKRRGKFTLRLFSSGGFLHRRDIGAFHRWKGSTMICLSLLYLVTEGSSIKNWNLRIHIWHQYLTRERILFLFLLFSRSFMSYSLWPCGSQHIRLLCPSPSPEAWSNSCSLSQWCHLFL